MFPKIVHDEHLVHMYFLLQEPLSVRQTHFSLVRCRHEPTPPTGPITSNARVTLTYDTLLDVFTRKQRSMLDVERSNLV